VRERRIRRLQGHPKQGFKYFLGGDPSGGTGNDDAAIIVLCADTLEQVFAFNDNTTNPVEYAYMCSRVGKDYNEAYLTIEGNNHGLSVHPILLREYPKGKIYKRTISTTAGINKKYGFITTEVTKESLVGAIRDAFDFGLTLYDRETVEALQVFEEDDQGKYGGVGDHLVIALGLASLGMLKKGGVHLSQAELPDRETHKQKIIRLMNTKMTSWPTDELLDEIDKGRRQMLGRFRRQVEQ
jgi:Terminase RNaseH-like domain